MHVLTVAILTVARVSTVSHTFALGAAVDGGDVIVETKRRGNNSATTTIFWASSPTLPDETVILHGSGLTGITKVSDAVFITRIQSMTPAWLDTKYLALILHHAPFTACMALGTSQAGCLGT